MINFRFGKPMFKILRLKLPGIKIVPRRDNACLYSAKITDEKKNLGGNSLEIAKFYSKRIAEPTDEWQKVITNKMLLYFTVDKQKEYFYQSR